MFESTAMTRFFFGFYFFSCLLADRTG